MNSLFVSNHFRKFIVTSIIILTILTANGAEAMTENENKLLVLATKEFGTLTEAEIIFFRMVTLSYPVDYSKGGDKNPANDSKWGQERVIRASRITWLCRDPQAASLVGTQGIAVIGARIEDELDLSFSKVLFPLIFDHCAIKEVIRMRGAETKDFSLSNSHIGSIIAGNAKILGSIHLDHARVEGIVDLFGAYIHGNLMCDGGHFKNKGQETIKAGHIKVTGDIQLNDGFTSEGEINLRSAKIGGDLQCVNSKFTNKGGTALLGQQIEVKGSVLIRGLVSEGLLDFRGATIGDYFEGQQAHLSNNDDVAIAIEAAKVGGPIFFNNAKVNGQLRLHGSIIGGSIQCDGGQFLNAGKNAFFAPMIKVHGDVSLCDVIVNGEVNFQGANIDGVLECDRSQFINKEGKALLAEGLNAVGGVHLRNNFKAEGEVSLMSAVLDKDLYCTNGHFLNESGYALLAEHIKIKGKAFLGAVEVKGLVSFAFAEIEGPFKWTNVVLRENVTLDLRHARMGVLWDDEASWPVRNHLWIDGLVYAEIDSKSPWSLKSRIKWLKLQPGERFYPQPYDQLAIVYNKAGQDENAKMVLIEKNRDPMWHSQMTCGEKIRHCISGITIDFGYHPFKALRWSLIIILIGWGLFECGHRANVMTPTKEWAYSSKVGITDHQLSTDYPKFNSFFYSLDTFVPVIDLHMKGYWLPNANKKGEVRILEKINIPIGSCLRVWLWLQIISGWILITLFIVGLTGLIKK
jgi:hypothetical protein